MTDIARARAILTAVHEKATPGPWRAISFGHGGSFTQIIQPAEFQPGYDASRFDNVDLDIADIRESAADAAFITLMVGLFPAIDALLSKSDPGNPYSYDPWDDESVDPYTDEVVHAAVSAGWDAGAYAEAGRIAAAILAWAERTGYEV